MDYSVEFQHCRTVLTGPISLNSTKEVRLQLKAGSDTETESNASERRNTIDIYADVLEVVKRHGGHGRVTRISYGVGMPVDRLKRFLERLERFALIRRDREAESGGVSYILTARGQEFLDTYWRMKGFLETLGEV